jgi:hypothetical protein
MSRCELKVRGRLPESVVELIRARFGDVVARGEETVLIVAGIDPAAERALLTLLWDAGHDVVSMRSTR